MNVASDAHRFGRLDFDDLGNEKRFRAMRVYGQSKLCNILFTYALARRLEGTPSRRTAFIRARWRRAWGRTTAVSRPR